MFDFQNLFSDAQALASGTTASENVLRLQKDNPESTAQGWAPIHDPGRGTPILVNAQIVEDVVGATTVQAQVVAADTADLGTGLEVLVETAAVPVAQLKAGYRFKLSSLPETGGKKFLALRYVVAGTPTAGKVTAGLTFDKQTSY